MFARWAATRNRRHVHAASARCGTVCGSHARLQPQGCQPIVQETLRKKKGRSRKHKGTPLTSSSSSLLPPMPGAERGWWRWKNKTIELPSGDARVSSASCIDPSTPRRKKAAAHHNHSCNVCCTTPFLQAHDAGKDHGVLLAQVK